MKSTASGRMPLLAHASQQRSGSLLYHLCFVQGETGLGEKLVMCSKEKKNTAYSGSCRRTPHSVSLVSRVAYIASYLQEHSCQYVRLLTFSLYAAMDDLSTVAVSWSYLQRRHSVVCVYGSFARTVQVPTYM